MSVAVEPEGAANATVTVTIDQLADDSIAAVRYDLRFEDSGNDAIRLATAVVVTTMPARPRPPGLLDRALRLTRAELHVVDGGGPQAALSSAPSVTWTRPLPSALTIQMLPSDPSDSERVKTILSPLGDHPGE